MPGCLDGKVAIITGASSGIGEATAIKFAEAGADVTMCYYSGQEKALAAAAKIESLGRRVLPYKIDVSDHAAVEAMVAETVSRFGRVDTFISSAVYSDREPFLTADLNGFRRTFEVSMFGAYYCLRAACNQMVKQGQGGSAVIVSSPHAQIAFPNAIAYNMAKAAIDQMARSAACELLSHRIRVNICYPGWTDTPGERKFFSEETIQKASKGLPWGRLATSEEVARAILFLADPASDYINGEILHIDGGLFLPYWSKRDSGDF